MSSGSLVARHYRTGQAVQVDWHDGKIQAITPKPGMESPVWVAPSLFDLQINGYAGVDFQQDNLTADQLLVAVRQLRAAGCGRFLLTLITDRWDRLVQRLRHLRDSRSQHPELASAIVGWHIEGPFLSAEPGFAGAHPPDLMLDPTPDHVRELREASGTDPILVTIAPERPGAIASIRQATALGFKVSLGHTNASAAIINEAIAAGATAFTHLGNACPKELDRHDNILWRILDSPDLIVSLIPDRIHVSPALFRIIHQTLPFRRIVYVTDAMAAAGAPPGRYTIGPLELEVGQDQVVHLPGKTHFAGSALRPIDGVFRASEMLRRSWQEVWDGFSLRPARFIGIRHDLAPGQAADFCLMEFSKGESLRSLTVYVDGEEATRAGTGMMSKP